MARKPSPPRVIPNFAMDKPASAPLTAQEQTNLAGLAALAGVRPTNRAVSDYIRQLDDYAYQQLVRAARNTNGGKG